MPTQFPTSLDDTTELPPASVTAGKLLDGSDSATVAEHPNVHETIHGAVIALETKLGVSSSADTSSVDYKLAHSFDAAGAAAAAQAASQPLDADLTTLAGLTATTDNFIISVASAWASRTPAQAKTTLALVKGDVGLGNVDNTADASKTFSGAQITSGTVPIGQLPTGTTSSTVPLGGVITAAGPIGDAAHTPVLTYNAAGQLTTVTNTAIALAGSAITSGTVAIARIPTGTTSTTVPLGGVITGAGPTGDASHTLALTYNNAGQLTAVTNNAIQIAESQVTSLTSDLALKAPLASPTFTGTVTIPLADINRQVNQVTAQSYAVPANMTVQRANGALGSETKVISGQTIGNYFGAGWNDTDAIYYNGAAVSMVAEQDFTTAGFRGSGLRFSTSPLNSATMPVRLILDNAGKLWWGATTGAATAFVDQTGNASFGGTLAVTGTLTAAGPAVLYGTAPATQTADYNILTVAATTAITNNSANHVINTLLASPVMSYSTAPLVVVGFNSSPVHQNTAGSSITTGQYRDFNAASTFKTTDTTAMTFPTVTAFHAAETLTVFAAGSIAVTNMRQFFGNAVTVPTGATVTTLNQVDLSGPVATGTVTTRRAINIGTGSGAGTFTTEIGIDIASLTGGATAIGIRNKSSTQLGSSAQTVIATDGTFSTFAGFTDGVNIAVGTTTGTQIGTATGQKIGFHGATPVVQDTTAGAAPAGGTGTAAGGWDTAGHRDTAITLINQMRTCLRNHGLMA